MRMTLVEAGQGFRFDITKTPLSLYSQCIHYLLKGCAKNTDESKGKLPLTVLRDIEEISKLLEEEATIEVLRNKP
jgi:hypothetical protein